MSKDEIFTIPPIGISFKELLRFASQEHTRELAAASLCYTAHDGQYRKYEDKVPYSKHPFEVAELVKEYTEDKDVICAAYLHDVLEDCRPYYGSLIFPLFGNKVYSYVGGLTNKFSKALAPKLNRYQRKIQENLRLAQECKEVKLVKLSDRYCNLVDLIRQKDACGIEFFRMYLEESKDLHAVIADGCPVLADRLMSLIKGE